MVSIPPEKMSEDWRKGLPRYDLIGILLLEKVNGGQFLFVVVHLVFSFDGFQCAVNTPERRVLCLN